MLLTLTTKASTTPVITSKLRDWLRVDKSEDSLLRNLSLIAANRFEKYTSGYSILDHIYTIYFDLNELYQVLKLPHRPIKSITSISFFDTNNNETFLNTNDYIFISGDHQIRFDDNLSLPSLRTERSMKIIYQTGFNIVPDDLIKSLELYTAYLYENRGSEEMEIPSQIQEFWDPYIIYRLGGNQ